MLEKRNNNRENENLTIPTTQQQQRNVAWSKSMKQQQQQQQNRSYRHYLIGSFFIRYLLAAILGGIAMHVCTFFVYQQQPRANQQQEQQLNDFLHQMASQYDIITTTNKNEIILKRKQPQESSSDDVVVRKEDNFKSLVDIKKIGQNNMTTSWGLPEKLFTVVGLESSGTTFVSKTLAKALKLQYRLGDNSHETLGIGYTSSYLHNNNTSQKRRTFLTEVQHVSLPWGGFCENTLHQDPRNKVIPVVYPRNCMAALRLIRKNPTPPKSKDDEDTTPDANSKNTTTTIHTNNVGHAVVRRGNNNKQDRRRLQQQQSPNDVSKGVSRCLSLMDEITKQDIYFPPPRYFLNITSHLEWYSSRGVDAHVIIVIRDESISKQARTKHCQDLSYLHQEELVGMESIIQAMDRYNILSNAASANNNFVANNNNNNTASHHTSSNNNKVIVVSYEMLNRLQKRYLMAIYKALGIDSSHEPIWKDGNRKYIRRNQTTYNKLVL